MTALKTLLQGKLTTKELSLVPRAFDQVGSIAIFSEFPNELAKKEKLIGTALLQLNPSIKTVAKKTSIHEGKYRTKKIRTITGEKTQITEHKESGVRVLVNIETCYFSPRLSHERLRIAKLVKKGEQILVLFSGVGVYPLILAKHSKASQIVGVETNPKAHQYALQNLTLNKTMNIELFKIDAKKFTSTKKFDRIILPLPGSAEQYFNVVKKVAKKGAIIHFYDFQHEGEFDNAKEEIKKVFSKAKILRIVKAGMYSSRKWRICVDFRL